jgi:DNA repair protein RadD
MNFSDLLSRCDSEVFQQFLGGSCTRLLALLDPSMSSPAFLRKLVQDSIGPSGLLLNPATRSSLLLLLRHEEASRLCVAIGVNAQSDPFAALSASSFPKGSVRETALFNFFELPLPIQDTAIISPAESKVAASQLLFEHQRKAARKVLAQVRRQPHRVLLHMPTGAGKTRTAMNVVCDHLRSSEPTVVIWTAYSEELCDQAEEAFASAWASLGDREVTLKRFWGPHQLNLEGFNDGLLIAGLPKLIRLAEREFTKLGELGTRTSLVVLDEAHQAVAPHYKHVLEALLAHRSDTGFIGLSATPGRTWNDVAADEELAVFFARRKVGLEIPGFPNPVDYLVDEGYLAKANFTSLFYQPGARFTEQDLQKLRVSLDVPENLLTLLGEDEKRNLAIISKIEELSKRHQRIIVFASTVSHAHLVANVLKARGHAACAITTKTGPQERTRNIDDFKSPKAGCMILCNYGVLTTGFDAPQTSCAVIARPTKSLVLYSQMVGRAIRGPRAGGNKHAEIVTVLDQQIPGFGGVADAFANWEDIWTLPAR